METTVETETELQDSDYLDLTEPDNDWGFEIGEIIDPDFVI